MTKTSYVTMIPTFLNLIRLCGVRADPVKLCQTCVRLLLESQNAYYSGPLVCLPFLLHYFVFGVRADPADYKLVSFFCKSRWGLKKHANSSRQHQMEFMIYHYQQDVEPLSVMVKKCLSRYLIGSGMRTSPDPWLVVWIRAFPGPFCLQKTTGNFSQYTVTQTKSWSETDKMMFPLKSQKL